MNAPPESPDTRADRPAGGDEFAHRLRGLGVGALRLLLQALQERRGSAAEQPDDFERVRMLGHEIDHRLMATASGRDLRSLDPTHAVLSA